MYSRLCDRHMLGVPKPESDTIINFLFHQVVEDVDFEVRFYWEQNLADHSLRNFQFLASKLAMHKSYTSWRRNPSLIKTSTRGGRAKWRKIAKLSYGRSRESRFVNRGMVFLGHAGTMTEMLA